MYDHCRSEQFGFSQADSVVVELVGGLKQLALVNNISLSVHVL